MLDLVAIYRALLDIEDNTITTDNITNVTNNVSINLARVDNATVINDAKAGMKNSNMLPDLVIDAVAGGSHVDNSPVDPELDDNAATTTNTALIEEAANSSCCSIADHPGQLPDLIPQQHQQPSGSILSSSVPDLLPMVEHHREAHGPRHQPDPLPQHQRSFRIHESVQELTERRKHCRRKKEEERVKEAWKQVGRQLSTISATFLGSPDDQQVEEDQWTQERSATNYTRGGGVMMRPTKFMTDIVLSVVTNAVIYVCIKKLKRLIF